MCLSNRHDYAERDRSHTGGRSAQTDQHVGSSQGLAARWSPTTHRHLIMRARRDKKYFSGLLAPRKTGSSIVAINANIATHPASGTNKPARRLPVLVEVSPTSHGIVAPPIPARANTIAPICLDLSPYAFTSHATRIG